MVCAISQAELLSQHLSLIAMEPLAFFLSKMFPYSPDLEYMERKMLYISCPKLLNSGTHFVSERHLPQYAVLHVNTFNQKFYFKPIKTILYILKEAFQKWLIQEKNNAGRISKHSLFGETDALFSKQNISAVMG